MFMVYMGYFLTSHLFFVGNGDGLKTPKLRALAIGLGRYIVVVRPGSIDVYSPDAPKRDIGLAHAMSVTFKVSEGQLEVVDELWDSRTIVLVDMNLRPRDQRRHFWITVPDDVAAAKDRAKCMAGVRFVPMPSQGEGEPPRYTE